MRDKRKRPGMMIYLDKEPAVEILTDEEAGQLFKALFRFALTGEREVFSERVVQAVFSMLALGIEEADNAYRRLCETRKESGRRGGRASGKKQSSATDKKELPPAAEDNGSGTAAAKENAMPGPDRVKEGSAVLQSSGRETENDDKSFPTFAYQIETAEANESNACQTKATEANAAKYCQTEANPSKTYQTEANGSNCPQQNKTEQSRTEQSKKEQSKKERGLHPHTPRTLPTGLRRGSIGVKNGFP